MEAIFTPAIVVGDPLLIPIVGIICGTLVAITAIILGKKSKSDDDQVETKTIQELYSQCNRLADRIEALETIILENERKHKS